MLKASLGDQQPWLARETGLTALSRWGELRRFSAGATRPCVDIKTSHVYYSCCPEKSSPWKQAHVSKDMQRLTRSFECCEVRGTRQGRDTTKILADRVKKGTGTPPHRADNTQDEISAGTLGAVTEMIKPAAC